MPGPISTALVLTLGLALSIHQYLEHRVQGALTDIHTCDTLYDKKKYGHILDYDRHSLILHGQPTLIISGEFHYWRLPDKSRWRPILEQYRSAGLNCIRIYFHWGFHSPSEGKYLFNGNRDIDYLLQLCQEIGLYVLAAPGPYICAETQAGGFPIWLAAKREIRLRHMKTNLWKEYDPEFMKHCIQYFENILPILAKHQITNGNDGCIIGLQIENESFQHVFGYPIGLHDDMKALAKSARDCGITVPFFTNDGFEQGSFIVKDDPKRKKKDFGIDLYGFDKYVVFTPNSEPTSWVVGRDPSHLEEWSPSTVMSELDKMEKKVRSFGHANHRTPIFIPELQGGWFNHYGIQYTYDAIYRFYGDQYTRLMLDTVVSQGCTMLNFYMFYGGTNWGTIGDSDVYTSYDYSACIREHGLMSGRLRKLRQGILFLQSFSDIMVRTDAVEPSKAVSVQSSLENTICQQRRSHVTGNQGPAELTFIRNFSSQKLDRFELRALSTAGRVAARLSCNLAYKSSFIALGNYITSNSDIHLVLSATPILIRGFSNDDNEIWITALATSGPTEMAFSGKISIKEAGMGGIHLRESPEDASVKVLAIPEGSKNTHVILSSAANGLPKPSLHIIFLDTITLSTLYCYYDNRHSAIASDGQKSQSTRGMASSPRIVTWGSYNSRYNPDQDTLIVESTASQKELSVLSFGKSDEQITSINNNSKVSIYGSNLPYQVLSLKSNQEATQAQQSTALWIDRNRQGIPFTGWETRITDFSSYDWKDCPKESSNSDVFQKVNLDFKFTSGHIIYRGKFKTRDSSQDSPLRNKNLVSIKINMRNRVIAFVNGVCIGSHMTYSRQLFSPGAKMGYDPVSFGSHTFMVPREALEAVSTRRGTGAPGPLEGDDQEHEVILVIDSFGLSRQPFVVDDIRNPRGLLSARIYGKDLVKGSESWQVAGVNVTKLDMAYESTGFPDEHSQQGWVATTERPRVVPDNGVTWWRTRFEGPPSCVTSTKANIPLCCRIEGEFSAMIILNDVLVGRFFGSDSPQHDFYLMDGLVHKEGQLNELKVMMYGSKETIGDINQAHLRILPWIVEDAQGDLGQWSGNAAFEVDSAQEKDLQVGPFWTLEETFSLKA
ncbi:hypothetical protein BGZ80_003833 [Entomortierella chlamydospora]|uniref:beta-galactosidase n=1 Tax=Entomortierella chlamydospora TaxID=101097 RepID=A0A9P6MN67_9FUNG|nr:hypothetical protein BGZ80_003833 [Entomortierella chlamydospora]